ncbi:uncharacterized protein LOC113969898 isoform X2 [Neopelma chrysocephalum]|uniref:uncharacterized protein LOC113969898 isoform X2 n=1 Tax=Neopelma chrysocephalum TaxID=114329 RepID=UPI000FCD34D6|nr:uncharacterized protein LOC113969898 isoform X2 [Neopelma chrysocephalum]
MAAGAELGGDRPSLLPSLPPSLPAGPPLPAGAGLSRPYPCHGAGLGPRRGPGRCPEGAAGRGRAGSGGDTDPQPPWSCGGGGGARRGGTGGSPRPNATRLPRRARGSLPCPASPREICYRGQATTRGLWVCHILENWIDRGHREFRSRFLL